MMRALSGTFATVIPVYDGELIPARPAETGACGGTYIFSERHAVCPDSEEVPYLAETMSEGRWVPKESESFAQVIASGRVKMTPMMASRRHVIQGPVYIPEWSCSPTRRYYYCNGSCVDSEGPLYSLAHWYGATMSPIGVSANVAGLEELKQSHSEEVRNLITSTQQDVYRDLNEGFDLLTELAEAPETLRHMSEKVGELQGILQRAKGDKTLDSPKGRTRPRRPMTRKQALKSGSKYVGKALSRWMEYRYAIMPLVYSLGDAKELLAYADKIVRKGSKGGVVSNTYESPTTGDLEWYSTWTSHTKVTSYGRLLYNLGSLQRLVDQVSVNLATTAWELIPLSFVVDWLFGISDALFALTNVSFASSSGYCTSVKEREYFTRDLQGVIEFRGDYSWEPNTYCFPQGSLLTVQRSANAHGRAYQSVDERYRRFVWSRPSGRVIFDPYLNWKRAVDSIALSHNPIHKKVRSL
jgi:hypothetical protein